MRSPRIIQPRTVVKSLARHLRAFESHVTDQITNQRDRERRDLTTEFRRSIDLFWPEDAIAAEETGEL